MNKMSIIELRGLRTDSRGFCPRSHLVQGATFIIALLFLFAKPVLATNVGNFTISVWVNPTTSVSSKAIISKAEELRLVTDASGNPLCQFKTTTWQNSGASTAPLQLNVWSHIVCTYDLTNIKIYVNGVQKGTTALTAVPDDTAAVFYAGRDASASTTYGFFTGLIDDYKFYNYNLSLDEILVDYNQGKALVLGSLSTGNSNPAAYNAASQEYCIPGDTTNNCSPPVGRWDFNEGVGTSAYDTSGNGNNGVWSGTGTHWDKGKLGKAGKFNGVDDYVSATISQPNIYSISAWVKPNSLPAISGFITSINNYAMDVQYSSDGKIVFQVSTGNWVIGVNTLNPGSWGHIVAVYDGTNAKIYLNGKLEVSTAKTLSTGNTLFLIGKRSDGYFFNGLIDQVRIYDYARTPAQIAWDYNRGLPTNYFRFNECQGTTLHDSMNVGTTATINIGSLGTQTSAGTCSLGLGSSTAWGIGQTGKYSSSLSFDGTDDWVNAGVGTTIQSVSLWVKPTSSSASIMQLATGIGLSANSGVISATGFTSPTTYVNGISSSTLTAGTWQMVTVTTATGIPATAIKFGLFGTTYFTGAIDEAKLWNYPLTSTQIKTEFNQDSELRIGPETGSP